MMKKIYIALILLFLIMQVRAPTPSQAALYWFLGVRDKTVSLCFVGDAVTSRPDRVQQIRDYIRDFEQSANIHFNYLGACPAATTQPNGNDFFEGEIRVVIPYTSVAGTGPVPGKGCPMFNQLGQGGYDKGNDSWGSWSNAPDDLDMNRPCLYNLKLGDDPWNATPYRNHTLHEFGHALGLSHDHERLDATCYNPANDSRWTDKGYMTPYDVHSVMHYKFDTAEGHTCNTDGNYGHSGLTDWDKLALHILYPEDGRVAEILGTTVIRAGSTLNLYSGWEARGARMDFVASNFVWKLNGTVASTTSRLQKVLNTPGNYLLEVSHQDFLGRTYTYIGTVRVLSTKDYDKLLTGLNAINTLLLTPDG